MKKFLYAVAVIATVAIAGWNYQQNKEVELSDLAMENVEALATPELKSGVRADTKDCYNEWIGGMGGYMAHVCKCTPGSDILFCI